jgi:hypothetical protein
VESAIEELKKASAGTDVEAISKAMEHLTQAQHKAAEALYKKTSAGGGTGGGGDQGGGAPGGGAGPEGAGAAKDDVIDAEVVDDK